MKSKSILVGFQCCCLFVGCMMMAKPLYRFGKRQINRMQASSRWEQVQTEPSDLIQSGDPVYWLRIPSCRIDDLVLFEDTQQNLDRHPALAQQSPNVILAHRDTHFRNLKRIQLKDTIELEGRDGIRKLYQVTEIEILPASKAALRLEAHRDPRHAVLMTCYPFNYLGPAPQRFLVWSTPLQNGKVVL